MANKDEKEKGRQLSEAEERRLKEFTKKCENWEKEGYRRTDLTISIVFANIFSILLFVPFGSVFGGLFVLVNRNRFREFSGWNVILFWIAYLTAIVLHEAIHGLTWAVFMPNGLKDIEFGIMMQYLTPYATCKQPLKKGPYILGALMPLLLLGIIPSVLAVFLNSLTMLFFGIIMSVSAAGDILIVWEVLKYKPQGEQVFYMDHPTQGGGVIFEK